MQHAGKAAGWWEAVLEMAVYWSGDYGGGGKEIEATTAGVSRNDWAAAKPIGEMGAWPRRHEEKREEAGEKLCEMEERESGGKQCFEEGMDKTRRQKVQLGENWERGKSVCCL